MRDYVYKYLTERIEEIKGRLRREMEQLYEAEPLQGSTIAGSVNFRFNIRNSFVFGTVVMEGSGKMVNCHVLGNVTVHVADGAIVADTVFAPSDGKATEVFIGKNALVYKSVFSAKTTIGEDSIIIHGITGDPTTNDFVFDTVNIGKGSFLCKVQLRARTRGAGVHKEHTISFGDNTIIQDYMLVTEDSDLEAGNKFCCYQYIDALKKGLQGIAISIPTESESPIANLDNYVRDQRESLTMFSFGGPSKFGDGCYLGVSFRTTIPNEIQKPGGIIAGDNVYIVPGSVDVRQEARQRAFETSLSCDTLRMRDNSTLVLDVPGSYEHRFFDEICIDENASLFLDGYSDLGHYAGTTIQVTKNNVIRL